MGPSRPDTGYAALTCASVVIRCTECGTAMGLATSELVQSCSDCGLSSRYGGYAFVGLDDDAADSALEATTVLPPQWLVSSGVSSPRATGRYDSAQHGKSARDMLGVVTGRRFVDQICPADSP